MDSIDTVIDSFTTHTLSSSTHTHLLTPTHQLKHTYSHLLTDTSEHTSYTCLAGTQLRCGELPVKPDRAQSNPPVKHDRAQSTAVVPFAPANQCDRSCPI